MTNLYNQAASPQEKDDPILQADWLATQSGYTTIDDLYQSDPDLFVALATEWRASPWDGLGD